MALRIVIVGPGRVGTACGIQLHRNGADLLGFVGRDAGRTAAAVSAVGAGAVLAPAAVGQAHVVLFAVADPDLPAAIAMACAAAPVRRCSLWVHTSGLHDATVFGQLGDRRVGCLHPVAPFGAGGSGAVSMVGAPGVYCGDPRSLRLLRRLCELLGLRPVPVGNLDRALYHAACALAANGLTALWALVERTFAAAGLPTEAAALLAAELMRRAQADCEGRGPVAALSGPVRRGDATTVVLHRHALRGAVPMGDPVYTSLMRIALELGRSAGLQPAAAAAVARALVDETAPG